MSSLSGIPVMRRHLVALLCAALFAAQAHADGLTVYGITPPTSGGTGVANAAGSKLTLGGALTTTGAGAQTLAFSASPFTYTFQSSSDTIVGRATTDTFTNKTFDTGGTGNSFSIAGTAITAKTGTGSAVLATSPTLTTPTVSGLLAQGTSFSGTTGTGVAAAASGNVFMETLTTGTGASGYVLGANNTTNLANLVLSYNAGTPLLTLQNSASTGTIRLATNSAVRLTIDANGHQITASATPTCGTGCSAIASGNDNAFTVTTGSAQTSISVNFGATWGATPICNVSSNSTASVTDIASVSTAAITFGASVALTGATLYVNCRQ